MRRLERIEARVRRRSLEPYARELAREMTEELGERVDPEELLAHAEWVAQRVDQIGWEQTIAEIEAEQGFDAGELWARLEHYRDRDGPHR
jgi:hypothetical protein